jgi:hypothetical protein
MASHVGYLWSSRDWGSSCSSLSDHGQINTVSFLYRKLVSRSRLADLWSLISGRPRTLLDLGAIQASCALSGSHYAGLHNVPISQIRGSEGRCSDFDPQFRPRKAHNQWRWLHIAEARQRGVDLPPVSLVEVGGVYFVRDGHHRISVAKALGQESISASVTVWELDGPVPGECTPSAGAMSPEPA